MKICDALSLHASCKYISLVGAGGKTTLLYKLANEFCEGNQKSVLMTTTRIYKPLDEQAISVTEYNETTKRIILNEFSKKRPIVIASLDKNSDKLCLPDRDLLNIADSYADRVIIEADGSHQLPMKIPATYEPNIFNPSDKVIAVIGLSALGQPLFKVCHRAGLAPGLFGLSTDTIVSPLILAQILTSEQGQFKNILDPSKFSIFLNQADDNHLCNLAKIICIHIRRLIPGCPIAYGSLKKGDIFSF